VFLGPGACAGLIDIIDTYEPGAVILFGIGEAGDGRDERSKMEVPARRWRKTSAIVLRRHLLPLCESGVLFLVLLRARLAVDAKVGRRASLQATDADLCATTLTIAILVVVELAQRLIDLAEQFAFAVAGP